MGLTEGQVFAHDFRVVRRLAEGGMGAVYVVEQVSTGKQRALKTMRPSLVEDERLRQRFEQEARVGARIASEHVVEVIGAGVDASTGIPWLAMELLEGEDLAHMVARRGPLPRGEVLEIVTQLCHAVGAAHDVSIVHRDLKPENVFLAVSRRSTGSFTVKVLDFGIAKVIAEAQTSATAAVGTPLWMAPEQTESSGRIDATADVWALGLIVFRLLTGRLFWRSASAESASVASLMREVLFEPIGPASQRASEFRVQSLPPGFDAWFARCVAREPSQRFGNAREMLAALVPLLRGDAPVDALAATALQVQPAPPAGSLTTNAPIGARTNVSTPAPPSVLRSRAGVLVGALLILALGGAAFYAMQSTRDDPKASQLAAKDVPTAKPQPILPLTATHLSNVVASSALMRTGDTHPAASAFDGNKTTAWCAAAGKTSGEWIEAKLKSPRRIVKVTSSTGFDSLIHDGKTDLFPLNSHVAKMRITVDGVTVGVKDVLEEGREVTFDGLDVVGTSVRVIAETVYLGTDTSEQVLCLSEITIFSQASEP